VFYGSKQTSCLLSKQKIATIGNNNPLANCANWMINRLKTYRRKTTPINGNSYQAALNFKTL
jgi:hypothetical protein